MMLEALIIPTPALCGILAILSGLRPLERLSLSFCSSRLTLGKLTLTVGQTFLTFAILRFTFQCFQVQRAQLKLKTFLENMAKGTTLASPDMEDRLRGAAWRADRNFWIVFFSLFLWLIYLRATQILTQFRAKMEQLKKERQRTPEAPVKKPSSSPSTTASAIGKSPQEIEMASMATADAQSSLRQRIRGSS